MPFLSPCLEEGSPARIDYRKKGALILTSLLEGLVTFTRGRSLARVVVLLGRSDSWLEVFVTGVCRQAAVDAPSFHVLLPA